MKWTIEVGRYDRTQANRPGAATRPYPPPYEQAPQKRYQTFEVELDDHAMVLDALITIREYQDESLAVRCACRSAICGSCGMWVNGHARLACVSKLRDVAKDGKVTVESPPSMPVIRDLVADMTPFWEKNRKVKPWLENKTPVPSGEEYRVPNDSMENLIQEVSCISCGLCLMDCESFAVNPNFVGPAALAKAYRYTADPRDDKTSERLGEYSEADGVWDCTHCYECVSRCPKGVAPLEQILKLRRMAVEAGFTNNAGTRHAEAFADSVRDSGRLNELTLMPKSFGLFNVRAQLASLPAAFNMLKAGKLPPIIHHKIPHLERIKNIFKRLGGIK
ncbi:MAG TPA: succinate dehydrogenase/fumarate reductase iron-sulfur subunit [Candidatus Acidoferrales bacterium]|nr:succinate dehydrogenase/fumarate reductase iron-sulfur subunit [Candidatus Acidoferrales bacterium]